MSVLAWSCLSPLLLRHSSHYHSHMKEVTFGFSSTWQNLEFWGLHTFEYDSHVPVSGAGEQNIAPSGVYKLEFWICQGSTLKIKCNWSLQVVINLESRQGKKKSSAFEWFAQNLTEKKCPITVDGMNILSKLQSHSVLLRLTLPAECCEIYFSGLWPPYISIRPLSI